jgi:hypothetical protein
LRALSKTAADRFYTAGEMRDALLAFVKSPPEDVIGKISDRRSGPRPELDHGTRVVPPKSGQEGDSRKTTILSDSDRTATRVWPRPARRVNTWLLVLAAFIAALIGRALEPAALSWLFGLGVGMAWLALALVSGVAMVLPLWLGDGRGVGRSRWSLAGWLACLDVLAIVAAVRLVQEAAVLRGAEPGALTGDEWLFLLFPFAALAGLLIWALLAVGGVGRTASPTLRNVLWTVAAGGLSACFGSILSALLPGAAIWLAAPIQMLVFVVSVGLLLRLSLGHWFVLATLTLIAALILPLLAILVGAEGETVALYGWLGMLPTAIGYAAGIGIAASNREL